LFAFPPPNRPARNRLNVKGLDRNQPAPTLPSLFRIGSRRPVSDTKLTSERKKTAGPTHVKYPVIRVGNHGCLALPYSAMSFQLSAPLNTAAMAIRRISSSRCSRFRSTRGSRNSENISGDCPYPLLTRSHVLAYSNLGPFICVGTGQRRRRSGKGPSCRLFVHVLCVPSSMSAQADDAPR
jgi:hypothetical protein